MYLVGDIGNTDIKIYLFDTKSKIIKKIRLSTTSINNKYINQKLKFLKKYRKKC